MSIISDIGNKAVKVVRLTGEFSKVANKQDLPKEMDKNNNNEVDVVEFVSYFFKPNAAPVKYQDDKGKIYLITVNPDGTIISRQEDEAPKISNGDTEEKKTQEGDSSNTAQARGTRSVSSSEDIMANQCLGEILKSLAAARRKLREKTKEIIEKNVKEIKEEEKIAARKRAQAKLEQVQRRIAKLEGKIAALHNVSPRQRAIVLAKLEALKAAVSKLEQMSYDLAEGKITMDQYEDQVKVVEEKAIAVEKQLDYEKNGLLISVFGGDYKKYLKDPSHALDDGKITIDDFKPEYQGLMWTAGEISNDDEITLEELEGLRDKGQASSCEELARKLGYKGSMDDPAADVYKAAYKDLRTAAQKGELNVDKWNSIMKKYGFDKYYTMKSEAFAALFLGVKDRWLHDERVSGTLNFDRAVHRTYMTMTAMGGPDEVAAAFQIYCKSEDFFFVDFEKQGEIIAGALGINRELSAADKMRWLLNPENTKNKPYLEKVVLELCGKRRIGSEVVDLPEEMLTSEQKKFKTLPPDRQWDEIVAIMLKRAHDKINVDDPKERLKIFKDILLATQAKKPRDGVVAAYEAELQQVIFSDEREFIDYDAILTGNMRHVKQDQNIPAADKSSQKSAEGSLSIAPITGEKQGSIGEVR